MTAQTQQPMTVGNFLVLAGLTLASLVGLWAWASYEPKRPVPTAAEQTELRMLAASSAAQRLVKKHLKTPATAEFPGFPQVREDLPRHLYSVIGTVDAQNDFGALVRNEYVIVMRATCGDPTKNCWDIHGLSIGGEVFVDKALPTN